MPVESSHITQLLQRWSEGDIPALDSAMPLLYELLHAMAHQRRQSEAGDGSLNTTGLVHEAYLKLAATPSGGLHDRHHFLALASRVMRNVLIDHARARDAIKRGGGVAVLALQEDIWISSVDLQAVQELDEALRKLEAMDARQGHIVEQRYFGGLSLTEIADGLDLSLTTVKRELRSARAWLAAELNGEVAV